MHRAPATTGAASSCSVRGCCGLRGCAILAVALLLCGRCDAGQLAEEARQRRDERTGQTQPSTTSLFAQQNSEDVGLSASLLTDTQPAASDRHREVTKDDVQPPPAKETTPTESIKDPHPVEEVTEMLIKKILNSCLSGDTTENGDNSQKKSDLFQTDCPTTSSPTGKLTTRSNLNSSYHQSLMNGNWTTGPSSEKRVAQTRSLGMPAESPLKVTSHTTENHNTVQAPDEALGLSSNTSTDNSLQNSTTNPHSPTRSQKTRSDKSGQRSKFHEDVMSVQLLSAESQKPLGYNVYEKLKNSDTTANHSQNINQRANVSSNIRVFEFSERSRVLEEDDDEGIDSDISQRKLGEDIEKNEETIVRDCTLIIVFSCLAVLVLIVCKTARYFMLLKESKREERVQVFAVSARASENGNRTLNHEK